MSVSPDGSHRSGGDKLYELRFDLNRVAWRITY